MPLSLPAFLVLLVGTWTTSWPVWASRILFRWLFPGLWQSPHMHVLMDETGDSGVPLQVSKSGSLYSILFSWYSVLWALAAFDCLDSQLHFLKLLRLLALLGFSYLYCSLETLSKQWAGNSLGSLLCFPTLKKHRCAARCPKQKTIILYFVSYFSAVWLQGWILSHYYILNGSLSPYTLVYIMFIIFWYWKRKLHCILKLNDASIFNASLKQLKLMSSILCQYLSTLSTCITLWDFYFKAEKYTRQVLYYVTMKKLRVAKI